MQSLINKDTTLCISLAARPSNFGTTFHNFLYRELNLNYIYKAFNPPNIEYAVYGIRGLGIRGAAVSMPFKEVVIPMLDSIDPSAARIKAVNTIVNNQGRLTGYNTDYGAVCSLVIESKIPKSCKVALLGSGGMAKAVACALHELGYLDVTIFARNQAAGAELASAYGYRWQLNFEDQDFAFLVNITPIGMASVKAEDTLPFPASALKQASYVMDVVANPPETQFIQQARAASKKVITGHQIVSRQAVEQFILYTGVTPPPDLIDRAAAFARSQAQ